MANRDENRDHRSRLYGGGFGFFGGGLEGAGFVELDLAETDRPRFALWVAAADFWAVDLPARRRVWMVLPSPVKSGLGPEAA